MSIHPNSNEANNPFAILSTINQVEGFDPSAFAVEYSDLTTGDTRKRLPVMAQMAWFRLKYPEGRISVEVKPAQTCFVAIAKVYPHYNDPPEHFLAEATASRSHDPQNPSVSPREWAQTAAVGVALRNAGFGLQFSIAGESFLPPPQLSCLMPSLRSTLFPLLRHILLLSWLLLFLLLLLFPLLPLW